MKLSHCKTNVNTLLYLLQQGPLTPYEADIVKSARKRYAALRDGKHPKLLAEITRLIRKYLKS